MLPEESVLKVGNDFVLLNESVKSAEDHRFSNFTQSALRRLIGLRLEGALSGFPALDKQMTVPSFQTEGK